MKKLFTVVVALMLAMCLMVPAFAEETASASGNAIPSTVTVAEVESKYTVSETAIVVTTTLDQVVNSASFKNIDTAQASRFINTFMVNTPADATDVKIVSDIYEINLATTSSATVVNGVPTFAEGTLASASFNVPAIAAPVPAGYVRTVKVSAIHEDGTITEYSDKVTSTEGCFLFDPATGNVTVYSRRFSTFIVNTIDTLVPTPAPTPAPVPAPAPAPAYTVVNTSAK